MTLLQPGLSLSAIEHLMLADDRHAHPMTFLLRSHYAGVIEPVRFVQAVEQARKRHPLLGSVIVGQAAARTRDLYWKATPVTPRIEFRNDDDALVPCGAGHLDPTREVSLRIDVRQGLFEATVTLVCHHSATDALGAVQFLEDLLVCYGQVVGEPLTLRPLTPGRLAGPEPERTDAPRPRFWRALRRTLSFLAHRPQALASDLAIDSSGTGDVRYEAPVPQVAHFKATAGLAGGTINDVLIAGLFRTLDAWNRSRGGPRPLRIAMPVNLRRPADVAMSAANAVGMAFLDRAPRQCIEDSDHLLSGVIRETQEIKTSLLGGLLLKAATRLGRWPGGVCQMMTPRWPLSCGATAVLSNLGTVFRQSPLPCDDLGQLRAGGLTLLRLELLPPVRPGTAVALGVVTYAGRMTISVRHDPAALSPTAAQALVSKFGAALGGETSQAANAVRPAA